MGPGGTIAVTGVHNGWGMTSRFLCRPIISSESTLMTIARKAGFEAARVVNTLEADAFAEFIGRRKG